MRASRAPAAAPAFVGVASCARPSPLSILAIALPKDLFSSFASCLFFRLPRCLSYPLSADHRTTRRARCTHRESARMPLPEQKKASDAKKKGVGRRCRRGTQRDGLLRASAYPAEAARIFLPEKQRSACAALDPQKQAHGTAGPVRTDGERQRKRLQRRKGRLRNMFCLFPMLCCVFNQIKRFPFLSLFLTGMYGVCARKAPGRHTQRETPEPREKPERQKKEAGCRPQSAPRQGGTPLATVVASARSHGVRIDRVAVIGFIARRSRARQRDEVLCPAVHLADVGGGRIIGAEVARTPLWSRAPPRAACAFGRRRIR